MVVMSPTAAAMASGRLRLQLRDLESSHHNSAIASVAVVVLMELGVVDPVPTFDALMVSRLLQQGF